MTEQERASVKRKLEELKHTLDDMQMFCNASRDLIYDIQEKLFDDEEKALAYIGWTQHV